LTLALKPVVPGKAAANALSLRWRYDQLAVNVLPPMIG
jgi:hypothetical protein